MPPEFETLIHNNAGRIAAIARRYADVDDIEDLKQEILEQLWRSFSQFRGDSAPSTWIYRIALNTAMTRVKKTVKQRRGRERLSAMAQEPTQPPGQCQAQLLEEFLQSLSELDASILMMYLDGLSGQSMAEVLGLKVNAIQVRVTRIKSAFEDRYVEVK